MFRQTWRLGRSLPKVRRENFSRRTRRTLHGRVLETALGIFPDAVAGVADPGSAGSQSR